MRDIPLTATSLAGLAVLAAALLVSPLAGAADGPTDESPWYSASMTRVPAADASAGAELEARETRFSARFGRRTWQSASLDFGADYQYTRYVYAGIDSRNRDLHRLQLPVHFETEVGAWQLQGYAAPGLSTSSNVLGDFFNRASGEDFLVTGRLRLQRSSAGRTWFAGIAHDRRFGRSRAYPVAGLEFDPRSRVHVRLAYPDPSIAVEFSERRTIHAAVYPAGHQWHVVTDDFSSEFDYRAEAWRGQLTWRMPLWKELGLDIAAGYEFGREHELADDTGARVDIDVRDQWFITAGIRLGPAPPPYTHGAGL